MYHLVKKGKGFFTIDLYRGDTCEGKRQGFGLQLFPNGSYYIGYWSGNQANGRGKLVLPDDTHYDGDYVDNIIMNGCVVYFNGARFDGNFDGTQYERFKNGTFNFSRGDKFKGEWKDGLVISGRLFDREGKIWEFFKDDTIIRKYGGADNYGVIISKVNKWFYEGGIEDNDCSGYGTIFCTFQQYKTGRFVRNQVNGPYRKVGLNWGEIVTGECEFDKSVGESAKMLNKGILIEIKANEQNAKVSFPFINEDYFIGQLYFLNPDKLPYDFKYKTGIYYFKLYTGGYKPINVSNLDSFWDIKEVKEKGISFEFTFEKIFGPNDKQKMANMKAFINRLIENGNIKLQNIHSTIVRAAFPEEFLENYSAVLSQADSKHGVSGYVRSKTPATRNMTPIRASKRVDISPNRKYNNMTSDISLIKQSIDNLAKTEIGLTGSPHNIPQDVNNFAESPSKEAANLRKTVFKYESRIDKSEIMKIDDIKETIIVKKDFVERSKTPDSMHSRARFKSFVGNKKPDIALEFNPIKSFNENNQKPNNDLKVFAKKLFDKINSSDDEELNTTESYLLTKLVSPSPNDYKRLVLYRDVKIIDDNDLDFFEGSIIKGKKQGFCKLLYNNGVYYEGYFNDDVIEGQGYMVTEHLVEYNGSFVKGLLQGLGTIKLGQVHYKGEFKNSHFFNEVVRTQPNGAIILARKPRTLENGLNGDVAIHFTNGYVLEAELANGQVVPANRCRLSLAGQKNWLGKVVMRKNAKFFESLTQPAVVCQIIDDALEYSLIV